MAFEVSFVTSTHESMIHYFIAILKIIFWHVKLVERSVLVLERDMRI